MEVLGPEFIDLSPQELAAPVNTVEVSSRDGGGAAAAAHGG